MSPTTAGLVGAALGAGGAVLAQMIAATATQLSETKRFRWEQAEADRRDSRERASRFVTEKRELYASFLASHIAFRDVLLRYQSHTKDELAGAHSALSDEVEVPRQSIVLLAPQIDPSLAAVVRECRRAVADAYQALAAGVRVADPYFTAYGESLTACRGRMTEDLNF